MARAKGPAPGEWRYQVETLTAYEREDRALAIYTRVLDGGRYRHRQRLCDPIRDEQGRIVPGREAEAIRLAVERQGRLASGLSAIAAGAPLTLALARQRMLHDLSGKYAGNTARKREVARLLDVAIALLGEDVLCRDIRHGHYRKLWRALAHAHVRDGRYGPEAAIKIVAALRAMIAWLQEEEMLEAGVGLPAPSWKTQLRAEWAQITERPVSGPRKRRYDIAESGRLWAMLPQADPRIEVAVQIGAELRLGQVLRTQRSDVQPYGGHAIGRVTVHGAGRKRGADVVLTMEARHVLTRAMLHGHLADLEAAYRRGEIDDYPLIPAGKLRTIRTRRGLVRRAMEGRRIQPWGRRAALRAWRHLESLAGVVHVEWRGWYGLRRISSDLSEDAEKDDRVLNEIGGWTDSATRREYQEQGRADIAERARRVREAIRPKSRRRTQMRDSVEAGT